MMASADTSRTATVRPNEYSTAENQMLADWEESIDGIPGWLQEAAGIGKPYPFLNRTVTKEQLVAAARSADYWNPLWRDEDYASHTRWGGIIGVPFSTVLITFSVPWPTLDVPESVGYKTGRVWWERNFFYKPVRPNDSFRVWVMRPVLVDVTDPDGADVRVFRLTSAIRIINQRDEVVATRSRTMLVTILREPEEIRMPPLTPPYVYTPEDLLTIDRLADEEVVRGAEPRYWEDVTVGDLATSTVSGPLTAWDSVVIVAGGGLPLLPMREIRKQTPDSVLVDPMTGVSHKEIEIHLSEGVARMVTGQPILPGYEITMTRVVTNWMGDDAFFRKLDWRVYGAMELGTTVFSRARVVRKYREGDECFADLVVWVETIKGNIACAGLATVMLPSRDELEIRL
jgi:acyl dehydratase